MQRQLLAGLAGALALLGASRANASAFGSVTVNGTCPSAALVEAALERRHLPPQASDHQLTIIGRGGAAEVLLTDRAGGIVATRRLESDDCSALAEATALIAETYFVELLRRGSTEQSASAAAAGSSESQPVEPTAEEPKSAKSTPEPPKAQPPKAPSATAPPPSRVGAAKPTPRVVFEAALQGGVGWLPERGAWSGVGAGVIGLWLVREAIDIEADPTVETATTIGSGADRVSRRETRMAFRVDRRFGGDTSLAPWVGIGYAATRLKLVTLAGAPTPALGTPFIEAGLTLRTPLAHVWSVRGELGCRVLAVQENYRVKGEGSIGSGPRVGCTLSAGVGWASSAP